MLNPPNHVLRCEEEKLMTTIRLLDRYRIDRAWGATAAGPERLVILVMKPNDGHETAYAISKADAMLIALALQDAALEVQADAAKST